MRGLWVGSFHLTGVPLATRVVSHSPGAPSYLEAWSCRPYVRFGERTRSAIQDAPRTSCESCQGRVRLRIVESFDRAWLLLTSWLVFSLVPCLDVSRGRLECRRDWAKGLDRGLFPSEGLSGSPLASISNRGSCNRSPMIQCVGRPRALVLSWKIRFESGPGTRPIFTSLLGYSRGFPPIPARSVSLLRRFPASRAVLSGVCTTARLYGPSLRG